MTTAPGRAVTGSIPPRQCEYCSDWYAPIDKRQDHCSAEACRRASARAQNRRYQERLAAGEVHAIKREAEVKPEEEGTHLHCLCCGKEYQQCTCACFKCGAKKWTRQGRWNEWKRHNEIVCKGKVKS